MTQFSWLGAEADCNFQLLVEDGDRILCRRRSLRPDGSHDSVLVVLTTTEHPPQASLERITREYGLKDELDDAWAVRSLDLVRDGDRAILVLEDPGGEPLSKVLGTPMDVGRFLCLAIGIAAALGKLHQRGIIHKDIKPANVLINASENRVWLMGFGIASRRPRERQLPESPEFIAGTLPYMAPEQTGRMNRSIDSRSDLYALGVTFYQMSTGGLPFTASDPMEWVHCHIARRPVAPAELRKDIPPAISAIIMQLLAKTAEERYQTAGGVERDLRRCLVEWEARNDIGAFPLREQDTPDRLLIPETLYGRAPEVEMLTAAFDRVVESGIPELILVAGYSGIGKSSVVNELHKALVPPRGLFASGKCDQYKRDIPYSTIAQAFQGLLKSLLGKSNSELAPWHNALLDALGPHGQLMIELVPELELIIGDQPPVPELPPQEAQRRFQLALRRFIGVFAQAEHPLALFLDDLQWLDAATLDLLEDLLTRPELRHLMLIGSYRDNEVTNTHPLMHKLDAINTAGGKVTAITLTPLVQQHLGQLIADAVHCETERALPLARLVHEKSGGNPFFAIQFLSSLADEGMLAFEHDAARWTWELDRIQAKGYTDNVVELLASKLTRLPAETQVALQLFACLGNIADFTMLSLVLGTPEEQVHGVLWPAVVQEQLERLTGAYRFVHDRVQEAAYSLIPDREHAAVHLRIGRLLVSRTASAELEERLFEIVSQLNRGAALITDREEREQLVSFNLTAGKRAKASAAHAAALTYFVAGAALMPEDAWERRHKLIFDLELHRAECEFLTGAQMEAETRLNELSSHADTTIERASVTCLRADLYTTLGQSDRAVAVCLDYLRQLGGKWAPHPTDEDVWREYMRISARLSGRKIEALVDLPLMIDPESLATMEVLTRIGPPAYFIEPNLHALVVCHAVNLSLENGSCDASCDAYGRFGMLAADRFDDFRTAYNFGQLGYDLVERHGLKRFQARAYMLLGAHLIPYARHVRTGRDLLRRAFDIAERMGDPIFAASCCFNLNEILLAASEPLGEVECEAERGLACAQRYQFDHVIYAISGDLGLIRTLRGLTPKFGCFDDGDFDENAIESQLAGNPNFLMAASWYWIRKLQARFHACDYPAALSAARQAQQSETMTRLMFIGADYHFYSALSHASACDPPLTLDRQAHLSALDTHLKQLRLWSENCPENFENRVALVDAEFARIKGQELAAERLYEQAIRSARDNGFVHNEALAYELAGRFYAARGFAQFARLYLRNARYGYLRWGADGKVRQLDELYPGLREETPIGGSAGMIGVPVDQLDLATVLKVSQAVSGETVIEKLIETLMRTAIEQASAERGLLIFVQGTKQRIAAEAKTLGTALTVKLRAEAIAETSLPESVLHYVLRTGESVILDDATHLSEFVADPYFRRHQTRSVLCLPLLHQTKLIGVLYLENNLASRVFAPARTAALKLLASQAATSIENARLYHELAEREAKIRRLVDANIIGIFIRSIEAELDGPIVEANDAFLRMIGYDREDLVAGCIRWAELTAPEWLDHDARAMAELKVTGTVLPFEKEYVRKDGSRVPVLIGAAYLENGAQAVAFVIDLSDRKRAEAQARESEQRYRDVQAELAHANRVAAMGQLTASIVHEVRQPIAAMVTSSNAALRWLEAAPPNLEEVGEALDIIVETGMRAGDIIDRIRALIKKAPLQKDSLDINETIGEVIALTRGEAEKNGVLMRTQFAGGLARVQGDRIQLQQVVLNLIINAIEAMGDIHGEPRELLITTQTVVPDGVKVAVSDTGPGLDSEILPQLFEAFYTTKPDGTGMGLSICRSIVEAHGGRLWASANSPRGAILQFTVPASLEITHTS